MQTTAIKGSTATLRVLKYELSDLVRSRWLIAYGVLYLAATTLLFRLGGTGGAVLLSLTNIVLMLIPLVSIVFGTMYLYSAREFTELLLTQPVRRRSLFLGLYSGLAVPLAAAFVAGVGLPFLLFGLDEPSQLRSLVMLLVSGTMLTLVFTALAFVVSVRFEEKVKGLAAAFVLWLFFTVIYDALVLSVATTFADYPLDRPMIVLSMLNPVDLARVLLLLSFDISALMGYSGAVFQKFFGSAWGIVLSIVTLGVWTIVPALIGLRMFRRKDF